MSLHCDYFHVLYYLQKHILGVLIKLLNHLRKKKSTETAGSNKGPCSVAMLQLWLSPTQLYIDVSVVNRTYRLKFMHCKISVGRSTTVPDVSDGVFSPVQFSAAFPASLSCVPLSVSASYCACRPWNSVLSPKWYLCAYKPQRPGAAEGIHEGGVVKQG